MATGGTETRDTSLLPGCRTLRAAPQGGEEEGGGRRAAISFPIVQHEIIKINNHIMRSVKTHMFFYWPLNNLVPRSNKVVLILVPLP